MAEGSRELLFVDGDMDGVCPFLFLDFLLTRWWLLVRSFGMPVAGVGGCEVSTKAGF